VLKHLINPIQAHDIYFTKEQLLQGKVDWLTNDPEAWDTMCEWWASIEYKSISERNWDNRWSKASVHHYRVDGHVHKT
jgi:hypothetical protein